MAILTFNESLINGKVQLGFIDCERLICDPVQSYCGDFPFWNQKFSLYRLESYNLITSQFLEDRNYKIEFAYRVFQRRWIISEQTLHNTIV
jgi:hypothetical protein